MKKADKILLTLIVITSLLSIAFSFYKTVMKGDFEIVNIQPAEGSSDE